MKAAQLMGPGLLEINDVPVPEIGPSELLIRVGAAESATPISISCTFRTRCAKNR